MVSGGGNSCSKFAVYMVFILIIFNILFMPTLYKEQKTVVNEITTAFFLSLTRRNT